jgi:hypothetical protein
MAVVPDTRYSHSKKLYMLKLNREIAIKGAEYRAVLRIRNVPDPIFFHPKSWTQTTTKRGGEKINKLSYHSVTINFTKLKII